MKMTFVFVKLGVPVDYLLKQIDLFKKSVGVPVEKNLAFLESFLMYRWYQRQAVPPEGFRILLSQNQELDRDSSLGSSDICTAWPFQI